MRHARLISRAAPYLSGTALVEKVISVPEGQLFKLQGFLRHYDLHGFMCVPKPDGLNLGDGQEYNEQKLIENPGQLLLADADFGFCIENPRASYKLTPDQFGAEFADASEKAWPPNSCWRLRIPHQTGRELIYNLPVDFRCKIRSLHPREEVDPDFRSTFVHYIPDRPRGSGHQVSAHT